MGRVYQEVERGAFFEARGGFWATMSPPVLAGGKTYFSRGQAAQVDFGIDIGDRFSPSVFFLASANTMGSDYTGLSKSGTASGDYGAIMPGAALKVRLIGFDDGQGINRLWVYARLSGGAVFYNPSALLPNLDVLITGGAGIEYFTRLRHFSIGLEGNFNFMALSQTFGFSVMPTLKYVF